MSFQTQEGRSVAAVTAEQMRDVDRVAVEEVGLELLMMMENAGRNMAEAVYRQADDGDRIVVLAGDSSRAGDGHRRTLDGRLAGHPDGEKRNHRCTAGTCRGARPRGHARSPQDRTVGTSLSDQSRRHRNPDSRLRPTRHPRL